MSPLYSLKYLLNWSDWVKYTLFQAFAGSTGFSEAS